MSIKHVDEYRDSEISKGLIKQIHEISKKHADKTIRLMEVCGTHTMAIFRSGIRSVLPENISLISGPGCPVCVTAQGEVDAFIEVARQKDTIIATFGDLIRVPGSGSSLRAEKADGRDIRIVYSPFDTLEIAQKNPDKKVIFLGVGFETTAPTIAATILAAQEQNIGNLYIYSAHKLTPPAVSALLSTGNMKVDGFIIPGHVSVMTGEKGFSDAPVKYKVPSVVTGFEPVDILQGILMLLQQIDRGVSEMGNAYKRAVSHEGNTQAMEIMYSVFENSDATWRGIGVIPGSGLKIRHEFETYDAAHFFNIKPLPESEPKGCSCGEILMGLKTPVDCKLFKKTCTPEKPVGPCMVSSEGTCAAYFKYHR